MARVNPSITVGVPLDLVWNPDSNGGDFPPLRDGGYCGDSASN